MTRTPRRPPSSADTRRAQEERWTAVVLVLATGAWGAGWLILQLAGADPQRSIGGALLATSRAIGSAIRGGAHGPGLVALLWDPVRPATEPGVALGVALVVAASVLVSTAVGRVRRHRRGGPRRATSGADGSGQDLDAWLAAQAQQDSE